MLGFSIVYVQYLFHADAFFRSIGHDLQAINSVPLSLFAFLRSLAPIQGVPLDVSHPHNAFYATKLAQGVGFCLRSRLLTHMFRLV